MLGQFWENETVRSRARSSGIQLATLIGPQLNSFDEKVAKVYSCEGKTPSIQMPGLQQDAAYVATINMLCCAPFFDVWRERR